MFCTTCGRCLDALLAACIYKHRSYCFDCIDRLLNDEPSVTISPDSQACRLPPVTSSMPAAP